MLKETGLDREELAQGLDVIDRNTRLQAGLIEELLDMNRIVSGKVRLAIQPVDLVELAWAGVESFRTTAAAKKIHLHYAAKTNSVEIPGDRDRLQQVLRVAPAKVTERCFGYRCRVATSLKLRAQRQGARRAPSQRHA